MHYTHADGSATHSIRCQMAVFKDSFQHVPTTSSDVEWLRAHVKLYPNVEIRSCVHVALSGENLTNHQPVWASSCEQCRNHLPRSWNRRLASDSNDREALVPQRFHCPVLWLVLCPGVDLAPSKNTEKPDSGWAWVRRITHHCRNFTFPWFCIGSAYINTTFRCLL